MPDYEKMYFTLFNRVTDAISLLQAAQQRTEEMFADGEELHLEDLHLIDNLQLENRAE